MNKKHLLKGICICLSAIMLTGCWDSMEINNRSIMLEFVIDKNTEYTYDQTKLLDDQPMYTIVYTIPDFGKLSGTESLAKDMETNIVVQAPSIAASIDNLETKSKNTVSFSHVKTILVGEALLKDPVLFKRAMDAMSRDMLIARNVPILAVNGDAEVVSQIENSEQPILGLYIMDYFNNKERATSFFKEQLLGNYIKEMEDTGVSTFPIFHVENIVGDTEKSEKGTKSKEMKEGQMAIEAAMSKEDKASNSDKEGIGPKAGEIEISGGAVIHEYELVGYLTKEEVRSQLFVEGAIKNSPVVIKYNDNLLTYNIKDQKSKITFKEIPEGLTCLIEIKTIGNISEYLSDENKKLIEKQVMDEIETKLANEIIAQVNIGIDKSKEMNIDFLGLGNECYRHEPDIWAKYKQDWFKDAYKNMSISIGVDVDVQSTGLEE